MRAIQVAEGKVQLGIIHNNSGVCGERVKPSWFSRKFTSRPFAFKRPIESGSSPARNFHIHMSLFVQALRPGAERLTVESACAMLSSLRFVRAPHSDGIPPVNLLVFPSCRQD